MPSAGSKAGMRAAIAIGKESIKASAVVKQFFFLPCTSQLTNSVMFAGLFSCHGLENYRDGKKFL